MAVMLPPDVDSSWYVSSDQERRGGGGSKVADGDECATPGAATGSSRPTAAAGTSDTAVGAAALHTIIHPHSTGASGDAGGSSAGASWWPWCDVSSAATASGASVMTHCAAA